MTCIKNTVPFLPVLLTQAELDEVNRVNLFGPTNGLVHEYGDHIAPAGGGLDKAIFFYSPIAKYYESRTVVTGKFG